MYDILQEDTHPFDIQFFKYSIFSSTEKIASNINNFINIRNIIITDLTVSDSCISVEYRKADEHSNYNAIAFKSIAYIVSSLKKVERKVDDWGYLNQDKEIIKTGCHEAILERNKFKRLSVATAVVIYK